jgi:hypothetical protein
VRGGEKEGKIHRNGIFLKICVNVKLPLFLKIPILLPSLSYYLYQGE